MQHIFQNKKQQENLLPTFKEVTDKIKQSALFQKFKIFIYTAILTSICVVGIELYQIKLQAAGIKVLKAGEYSVSINERNELTILERDYGKPVVVDSILTETIHYELAAKQYVKTNMSH